MDNLTPDSGALVPSNEPLAPRMLTRREALALAVGAGISVALAGCGSGGGEPASGESFGRIRSNVVLLPSDGSVALSNVTDTSVTLTGAFPGAVPDIQVGSVIVSGQGEGLLRKVTGVSALPGTAVITTEQGTLEDLFEEAHIVVTRQFGPADIAHMELDPDTTFLSRGVAAGRDPTTLSFEVTKAFPEQSAEIKLTFTIGLEFNLEMDISSGTLESARWVPKVSAELEVKAKMKLKSEIPDTWKLSLVSVTGSPMTIVVGPVPVTLVPALAVSLVPSGSVEGGMQADGTVSGSAEGGAIYSRAAGWSTTGTITFSGSGTPGKVFATVKAGIGIEVAPNVKIFGIAGPGASFEVKPEFSLKATGSPFVTIDPPTLKAKVELGVTAKPEFKAEILGRSIASWKPEIGIGQSFTLYEHSFVPGDAKIGVD
jgi:hypothetical protein